MKRQMVPDGALIYLDSHELTIFKSGISLGSDFEGPVHFKLDKELRKGPLPSFFTSPALVSNEKFYNDLIESGVDNVEKYPTVIKDEVDGRSIEDFLLLNIVGRVSCADMDNSDYETLGEGMNVINKLTLDSKKILGLDFFHVAEDTDCIVLSEKVYSSINSKGYTDIYFEELDII